MNFPRRILVVLFLLAGAPRAFGRTPSDAPPLPQPGGSVVVVSDVDALYRAVAALRSNTTILVQRGTYQLRRPVYIRGASQLENIAIRGATGNFNDVVLRGAGMGNKAVPHGILADNVDGLLIADMTIGWVGYHPIALSPHGLQHVHVYHCRLVDAGEQFIKVSWNGPASAIHDGLVEYCLIEYANAGPADGYTNGIDILGGHNWVIRHNLFRNIRGSRTGRMVGPAVLAWYGAENTRCQQNTFVNCDRPIVFGLLQRPEFHDQRGGIISNNFIVTNKRDVPWADAGISVGDSPATQVLHNTILLEGAYPNAIEVRWQASKDIVVQNNLIDARIAPRDGASLRDAGNQQAAKRELFQNAAAGDLHLAAGVRLHTVATLPDCTVDWDDAQRPAAATCAGADDPASQQP